MTERAKCLQEKIGDCGGCEVRVIVAEKIMRSPRGTELRIANNVSRDLCPSGTTMQLPERSERRIW